MDRDEIVVQLRGQREEWDIIVIGRDARELIERVAKLMAKELGKNAPPGSAVSRYILRPSKKIFNQQ